LSGNTAGVDTAFDLFLMNPNNTNPNFSTTFPETELMIMVHTPDTPNQHTISVQGLTNAGVDIEHYNSPYIAVGSPQDALSGTISIGDVIKTLLWNGVISPDAEISAIQFGSEVNTGNGSMTLNNFSVNWQGNPNVTVGSSNTLSIATMGGNHIFSNGNSDTVVYSGAYAQYQIEQMGSDTFITENNNISTLDDLNGIAYIQFSNGTYNVSNHTFTSVVGPTSVVGQAHYQHFFP